MSLIYPHLRDKIQQLCVCSFHSISLLSATLQAYIPPSSNIATYVLHRLSHSRKTSGAVRLNISVLLMLKRIRLIFQAIASATDYRSAGMRMNKTEHTSVRQSLDLEPPSRPCKLVMNRLKSCANIFKFSTRTRKCECG